MKTVKIGVIAPLTGDLAFIGEGFRDAALLAKDDLKNTKYNYELIFEDDQIDPIKTVSAVNKLMSVDKVDAVITISSGPGNAVAPIAEQNKIIHFATASDQTIAKGDYNFIHWTPPSEEVKVLVDELKRRGIKKLGVFELNQQGIAAMMTELRERIKGTEIEIVTDQKFNFKERDFKSLISKAKSSGAEIYLLNAFSPELEILAKQIKELGITTPLTAIESFEITEKMDLFEGQWYVNAADATGEFTSKFKEKTGKMPTIGTANGYDMINLIATAYENYDSLLSKPNHEQIVKELYKIKDYKGALGNLNMGPEGIVISKAVVRMIKDGKPVTISQ
ncbi:ABC transporter substrate-binding protein [Candidatus Wolfebacteria bacterium]|nr:ABC transporter substrate-binding protein [Candidatus Wolfebacteria bacterium]